ncbi:hypothetical protein AK830_g6692 [Neonectria ditissima]|uniref:Transcription factor domain-containing protein n=1 Tax=Neonectria ditissima TaxID=78410 RepID=A0A0P7BFU8_9HYPO|nr:hypothetical protein AK830_g6692 [Neonectria ditissima]
MSRPPSTARRFWSMPCALRDTSMTSLGDRGLGTQFFDEAGKVLDLEGGRASLPTVQGLTLLFTMCTHLGTVRASMVRIHTLTAGIFFLASQLSATCTVIPAARCCPDSSLEAEFEAIQDDPAKLRHRQVISKAVWGLFCYESIVAYVYLELSLIPSPKIPRCFEADHRLSSAQPANFDLFGAPYTAASKSPPFVPGIQHAICDLSMFLHRAMRVNGGANIGSDEDFKTRRRLYREMVV